MKKTMYTVTFYNSEQISISADNVIQAAVLASAQKVNNGESWTPSEVFDCDERKWYKVTFSSSLNS